MRLFFLQFVLVTILVSGASLARASDTLDGGKLFRDHTCGHCHGHDGRSPAGPRYPKLAGQSEDYLFAQLRDFRSGQRNNNLSSLMRPMAARLSDGEMQAIARYLSELD